MAFPFFPESHPSMTVENYTYMRQLWQHQTAIHDGSEDAVEPAGQRPSSSSAGRPSSEQLSLRLRRSGSGSGVQGGRRPSKLARIFIPPKLRRSKSVEDRRDSNDDRYTGDVPCISPPFSSPTTSTATRPGTSTATTISTTTTTAADPARHIFRLYSALLTNPFSLDFELNPLLLNINHPLLSKHHTRRRNLKVLDLGGVEGSVYTRTIAGLPYVAVCQLTQPQLATNFSPYLPFKPKSFDVVTTRTLYKFIANPHRSHTLEAKWWVQQIHRILDKGGNFEFFFFDSHLSHAGPLTRQMEPCLYEEHRLCSCGQTYEACACRTPATADPTAEAMTGAQFLELLAREGFTTEKCTTLMFPFSLLSSVFTQDGQQLKMNQTNSGSGRSEVTPLLVSLIKMIDEECRETQTAWKCIIGSARKNQ
ncbi:hypothetical protein BJY01DRAFT_255061 [Aspergillus pseudoustus]|uniref:Methyltransferase type 11 domain-containing protein n=1 Tax=Aspergillus pseudoustus TaxID=1810923 RepID=A0ABR4INI3_9EURO